MKYVLLSLVLLTFAVPVFAGTWDTTYVWDAGQSAVYPGEYKRMSDWGIYDEGNGNFSRPQVPDRYNRMPTQIVPPEEQSYWVGRGAQLDWTGSSGGKIKHRLDNGGWYTLPWIGHIPDYTKDISLALGINILGGNNPIYDPYISSSALPLTAPESGHPRIQIVGTCGAANFKATIAYKTTPQTIGGVSSNWYMANGTATGATGNWLMPNNTWANIQITTHTDATWDAYLVRDGYQAGHMWGTMASTGDAVSVQWGITSTCAKHGIVYDYAAFGWGSENIGDITVPEPGSILALGTGIIGMLGMLRKKK